ncbi:replication-relaxation family protein, partial [Micromonospora sp. DT4]|uniref:replication-relaxation family protein n=1 Tax=Micromonospora sp. DT4 TaxID=3393438 RepID=UPI003CE83218
LAQLHQMEAVSRFVDVTTGSGQYLYTLGPLGAVVHPTQFNDPNQAGARAPRTSIERTERIIGSRRLAHLLGTNQLFVDLVDYARTDEHARLARWWSEQHTTAAFAAASYAAGSGAGVQPDGHGIWHAGGRTVGFFLEHDNGTEPL